MKAFRRHIVVDNIQHIVFIQVMPNFNGNLKTDEATQISRGTWWPFVPVEIKQDFAKAISQGYRVEPFVCIAMQNEEYYVMQITELQSKPLLADETRA